MNRLPVVVLALCCLVMISCGKGGSSQSQAAPAAPPQISGTWSGTVTNYAESTSMSFSVIASLNQDAAGNITGTITRGVTDCWDSSPIQVRGNFMNSGRQFFLQDANTASMVMVATLGKNANSVDMYYSSIAPDRKPCYGIAAGGKMNRN